MRKGPGIAVLACALTAAIALPASAGAATRTVYAGANKALLGGTGLSPAFKKQYQPDANTFFGHKITINAGDTIDFINNGAHTIDIPASGGRALPLILSGSTITGVDDFAGNPFWFNGIKPSLNLNPALTAPIGGTAHGGTYDGASRIDSGIDLSSSAPPPFDVKFTKPGTYEYFCDFHPGMIGYVTVLPKGKPIPSVAQDLAADRAQARTDVATLKRIVKTKVPADHVSLGESGPGGVEAYAMFPASLKVKTGSVVTFSMSLDSLETHTATFGPSAYLTNLGNEMFSAPGPTQISLYPSSNPADGPIQLGPTSHGNGFANGGALSRRNSGVALPSSEQIDFTKPGTYHFECLIHPWMTGTIVVS